MWRVDLFFSAGFDVGLDAALFAALGALVVAVECTVDVDFTADLEVLRRCAVDVRRATTGSATRMRVPAATLMPVNLFQRRN